MHLALIGEIKRHCVQNIERRAHPPPTITVEIAELTARTQRNFWRDAKAAHMTGCGNHRLGDLVWGGLRMNMRIGNKERPIFQNHQGQRPNGM